MRTSAGRGMQADASKRSQPEYLRRKASRQGAKSQGYFWRLGDFARADFGLLSMRLCLEPTLCLNGHHRMPMAIAQLHELLRLIQGVGKTVAERVVDIGVLQTVQQA